MPYVPLTVGRRLLSFAALLSATLTVSAAGSVPQSKGIDAVLLARGLQGATGSALGPGGALYVTEGAAGRISRVDPQSGTVTTFASGLPPAVAGIGGAIDVAFVGTTAYVLVTMVGPDVGGNDVVGIYRMDGPDRFTVVADIGAFSLRHPPKTAFFIPTGVQYAIEPYRDGFLVTDGHHNRVLQVTRAGKVSEWIAFDNIVPTGLAVSGGEVYMAEAGPVPHLPHDGKVLKLWPRWRDAKKVASGASLLVDVEFGRAHHLYALSQGQFAVGSPEGSPAQPGTGALLRVNRHGAFTVVVDGLNQPTSLEFIGNTAYVVSLAGEVWRIDGVPDEDERSNRGRGDADDRTGASTDTRLRPAIDAW